MPLAEIAAVERVIADMRAGRPVVIDGAEQSLLCLSVEALDERMCASLIVPSLAPASLILSAARLRRLGHSAEDAGALTIPDMDYQRITTLALAQQARLDAPPRALRGVEKSVLPLAALAFVLPALLVMPTQGAISAHSSAHMQIMRVSADAIEAYRRHQLTSLRIMARAPVPLEGAPESEFVIFRGGEGLRDHVAVVVGRPALSGTVLVRLHSACLTGDLFGSLKCDCGDQLRHTARFMAEQGGGILLYLDQEGRGNGLANKIRAYHLQAQGFDTYDADEVLGFEHDQRRFAFAAHMLGQLGVSKVRLLTNNPLKIQALKDAGLDVVSDERIWGRTSEHNIRYLASKRDRAGHMIELGAEPLNVDEGS
jgi:GTP cyclohydrolase II